MFHLHEVTSISQSTARLCGLFFFAAIGDGIIRHFCAASDFKPAHERKRRRTQDLLTRRALAAQSLLCCKC